MSTTLMTAPTSAAPTSTAPTAPVAPAAGVASAEPCRLCHGSGWADPWEVHDGAPMLTWCDHCLGAGLDACSACDGEGVVPEPTPCPCITGELDGVPLAA